MSICLPVTIYVAIAGTGFPMDCFNRPPKLLEPTLLNLKNPRNLASNEFRTRESGHQTHRTSTETVLTARFKGVSAKFIGSFLTTLMPLSISAITRSITILVYIR